MNWLPLLMRGDSCLLNDDGCCDSSSASELKVNEPSVFTCWFWVNASRRSSVVSLMRCLLLLLNHDSWLVSSVPVLVWLVFMFELPPNATVLMLVVPSGNAELM